MNSQINSLGQKSTEMAKKVADLRDFLFDCLPCELLSSFSRKFSEQGYKSTMIHKNKDYLLKVEKDKTEEYFRLREQLIVENIGLALSAIPKRYARDDDFKQTLLIGFVRAIDTYDQTKNISLSYWFFWFLKSSICVHRRESSPSKRHAFVISKLKDALNTPSLARTEDQKALIEQYSSNAFILAAAKQQFYVDIPDKNLVFQIKDNYDDLNATEQCDLVSHIMSCLDKRSSHIVSMYYGLEGSCKMSIQEIANMLGLSRQRVDQILHEAIKQMREYCKKKNLSYVL